MNSSANCISVRMVSSAATMIVCIKILTVLTRPISCIATTGFGTPARRVAGRSKIERRAPRLDRQLIVIPLAQTAPCTKSCRPTFLCFAGLGLMLCAKHNSC